MGHAGAPRTDRTGDLITLARLSAGTAAVEEILGWLAGRTGGAVALLGIDGDVVAAPPGRPPPHPAVLAAAATAVSGMHRHGTASAVLGEGPETVDLVRLGSESRTFLMVTGSAERRHGNLLADAARILGLCWRLQEAERTSRRVASAMAHSREAVLHLLMAGSLAAARRIAATLGPRLPDHSRVYVVECPAGRRRRVADRIERFAGQRAWIVPCPVHARHLIALVPPGRAATLDRLIAETVPEARVGASDELPLSETAIGYEQAFHALAVARGVPGRYARFDRHTDLTPLVEGFGHAWAAGFLAPCLSHTPARRADPGAEELLATLYSWLTFDSGASRHLKIHRNTLSARLHLLDGLLGVDLTRMADQSAAWLAVRLHAAPRATPAEPGRPVTLDRLLATPAAKAWAQSRLRPLERAGPPAGIETLDAWLRTDTRLSATAAALGISVPAVRKRLARIEQVLGRSLLHAPSAKHELWLAMRASGSL
ncbi:helix-turn-helix domain-containing protein [Amycolatopsis sp. RTGN1]|uniref:helix-turn-helix domain-containing protein n=1 Tax=Amycolatopsis ponsaeliensis TaxID=2992142 RepID=UPI00254B1B38|nr:helix-turn-helix domain-containing protein [Amycolatopsis sp. RTGN1]